MGISATCDRCGAPIPIITAIVAPLPNQPTRPEPSGAPDRERRDPPLLLKIPDAARELGISVSTLYKLLTAAEIRSIKVGPNATRIPRAEIDEYIVRKLG